MRFVSTKSKFPTPNIPWSLSQPGFCTGKAGFCGNVCLLGSSQRLNKSARKRWIVCWIYRCFLKAEISNDWNLCSYIYWFQHTLPVCHLSCYQSSIWKQQLFLKQIGVITIKQKICLILCSIIVKNHKDMPKTPPHSWPSNSYLASTLVLNNATVVTCPQWFSWSSRLFKSWRLNHNDPTQVVHTVSTWWFQTFFIFTPKIGEMI